MKILFISGWFPLPADNGSKIRIYNLLSGLCKQHEVTLLAFYRQDNEPAFLPQMREICAKVEIVPWQEFNPSTLRSQLGFFSLRPRSLLDSFSPRMQALISKELSEGHNYQLGIISETNMLAYLARFEGIPLLLEDPELAALYDKFKHSHSLQSRIRNGLTWWKTSRFITRSLTRIQACTVVSDVEKTILNEIAPYFQNIHVIPNCVEFTQYERFINQPIANRLVFAGSLSYKANFEAVEYFLDQVWPIVKKALPDTKFWITGKSEGFITPKAAQDPQVLFTGYVEDIRPVVAGSALSIVPLLSGGGTRLKILEALALNTAVVSTSKGAEGLDVSHEEHLLLADTPNEFAAAVIRLQRDEALRSRLARQGRELVRQKYNWSTVIPQFMGLVESIAH